MEFGRPQILINGAAVFTRMPLEKITFEQSRKILDLNLTASILTSKAFVRIVKAEFGDTDSVVAKIINIADIAGIRPWAEYCLYSASKAGLIGATKSLAKELAPNICVNSVAPVVVACANDLDSQQEKRQLSFIPLARFAEKKEIAAAVIFLLENDYITGQTITVDGGRGI